MSTMTQNLTLELDRFQERVTEDPSVAEVSWKAGSGGGGAFGWVFVFLLLAASCGSGFSRERTRSGLKALLQPLPQEAAPTGAHQPVTGP